MGCGQSKNVVESSQSSQGQAKVNSSGQRIGLDPGQSEVRVDVTQFKVENTGKLRDYYKLGKILGSGAFGEVRVASHLLTNEQRAVKVINRNSVENPETFFKEVHILQQCDHPNIVRVNEFFQDPKRYYLVTEFCTGGELFDKISAQSYFTEVEAAVILKQIMSAVAYCHAKNIVHRDLKPENLLLESTAPNAQIKVIDFGTSTCKQPEKKLSETFGTPYYIAPEVLKSSYDEKCDIWSCGVIMYILLSGYPPFNGPDDKGIIRNVIKGQYQMQSPEWQSISKEAKSLIRNMLQKEVPRRYSAQQVLDDPWFTMFTQASVIDRPVASNALSNLKNFRAEVKMQQATIMFITSQLTTREEREHLQRAFQAMDKNGDGRLSMQELKDGYLEIFGEAVELEEMQAIMKQADVDGSGFIDYTEFVAATMNRNQLLSKDKLEAAFRMFDKDGSGTITTAEIQAVLGKTGTDEMFEKLIAEVDVNADGVIDLQEFKELMLKLF